jgi:hypothetical protein
VQAGAVAAGISVSWISWGAEQSLEAVANVKDLHQAGELENACYGPVPGHPDEVEPAVDPVVVAERRDD